VLKSLVLDLELGQTPDYLNLDSVRLLRWLEAMGEDIAKVIESTKEGGKLWKIKL